MARETAHLTVLDALIEKPYSASGTHMAAHVCNHSSRGTHAISGFHRHQAQTWYTCTHANKTTIHDKQTNKQMKNSCLSIAWFPNWPTPMQGPCPPPCQSQKGSHARHPSVSGHDQHVLSCRGYSEISALAPHLRTIPALGSISCQTGLIP